MILDWIKGIFNRRVKIEISLRHRGATPPNRIRDTDAGFDVYSMEDVKIGPGDIVNINTHMAVVAPRGYYFTVEGRSSLYKVGVVPFRGIIDGGYTGDMVVSLMNVSKEPYYILRGDRIAQLVLHKLERAKLVLVDEISPEYNIRGTSGFGSSGR